MSRETSLLHFFFPINLEINAFVSKESDLVDCPELFNKTAVKLMMISTDFMRTSIH